jgi:outer membrane immunogenic protein
MKMRRGGGRVIALAFVTTLSNAMGFSARAADLAPIARGGGYYNWSGYYVGGNLGAGVGRMEFTVAMPGLATSTSDEIRGFVGGAQGGFNWQNGPLVAGIEADVQYSHQRSGVNAFELQVTTFTPRCAAGSDTQSTSGCST